MRSKASYKGHPLHPALIPFPFAFLYGAFLFDVAGVVLGRGAFAITAGHLAAAGVLAALVAAVPGVIDYRYSVPPRSTGASRARRHAAANLSAVALMAIAWLLRPDGAEVAGAAVLLLEAAAVVLLTMGGWMGGTLVSRNQIGVDHRYAGAGKWREVDATTGADGAVVVPRPADLETDQLMLVHADGRRIVLGRTADGFVAFDDRCSHRGGSLADGVLIGGVVQCPWHGSQFETRSGRVCAGPAREPVAAYAVDEHGDELRLRPAAPHQPA
jgi:nitrite reductase/ring-hydroxylating ferredoxin subunit/uncharacterized membrane protein